MPHRFYKQEICNGQLQAYIFIDTNARVPAKGSMYVIFHEPTKDILGTTQQLIS